MHIDQAIAQLAETQRGLVARDQLMAAGIGRGAIAGRLRRGGLYPVHRGVYLVGHPVPPPFALELAAVLACGPGAVLSHRSAGELWSVVPRRGGDIEVTAPVRGRGRRPGIQAHHDKALGPADSTLRHGIPVTTAARTLIDLAGALDESQLESALAEAWALRLVTRERLAASLVQHPRRRGASALRALLRQERGPSLTRSEAEKRLLALVRRAQLPAPHANARVGRYEIDLFWPSEGLAVEVDGYAFHSSPRAFERDRRRDAELSASGLRVLRVTWRQLVDEPEAVVARLARALAPRSG